MPQNFNIEEARKHYSDEEILLHLVKRHSVGGKQFDVEGAMKQGYSTQDLIEHLSSFKFPEKLESNIPQWGQKSPKLYQAYQVGKGATERVAAPLTEATGAAMGAEYGSALGPWGALAGGALGYAISKGTMRQVDKHIQRLEKSGPRRTNLQEDMLQALYDLREGTTYEMFGRGIGEGLPRISEVITAPFQKRMTPEARFVLEEANKRGIELTPAEVTGAKSLALGEALMEKIWGASDIIRDMRLHKQIEPLQRELNELLLKGGSKESVENVGQKIWDEVTDYLTNEKKLEGDLLNAVRTKIIAKFGSEQSLFGLGLDAKELLKSRVQIMRDRKNELYNAIGEVMPGGGFETPNLAKEAKAILNSRKALPNYGLDKDIVTWLKWAEKTENIPPRLAESLSKVPKEVRESILADLGDEIKVKRNWTTLQEFKRDMEAIVGEDDPMRYMGLKGQMGTKGYIANRLKHAALEDMRVASESSPEALLRLKVADAFYGDYARVVKSKLINKLVKTDPGKIIDIAFRPNGIEEVKLLKEALGPDDFLKLTEGLTRKLVGADKQTIFDPKFFRNNIIKYGDETLSEIYGKTNTQILRKIAEEGFDITRHKAPRNFLKSISELDPDFIVDRIIGAPESKLASTTMARNLKTVGKSIKPETFNILRDKLAEKLFTINQTTDLVRPISFTKMVDKYNERVLKKFFPYAKVEELKTLANISRKLRAAEEVAGNPSGTGQTLIAWGMFRMIMTNPVTGAIVSFTPKQLAKIYTSKFGMKWLTEGFKLSTESKKASVYFTRLMAIAAGEELEKEPTETKSMKFQMMQ